MRLTHLEKDLIYAQCRRPTSLALLLQIFVQVNHEVIDGNTLCHVGIYLTVDSRGLYFKPPRPTRGPQGDWLAAN